MSFTCSISFNFFMCKVEMLPHTSLGCVDSMRHQVILGLLRTASGFPFNPGTAVLFTSGRKTVLSFSVAVYLCLFCPSCNEVSPPENFSHRTLLTLWETYLQKFQEHSVQGCRPLQSCVTTAADSGQYQRAASRVSDDMHFHLRFLD